ncbi:MULTISPECIES: hypothetical protein [unclassified Sphingomonas]|uniref:hypothetical protein n=1 Tax=unclassified Sphingomonas TaxID=196159 RepID=UPI0022B39325|nr:hypothetical protein [Sphingomonas sp. NIBR02145]WHU04044.1 hypothetical protein O3305_05485 [Sphingomonas sp. NIBR02145]
MGDDLDEMLGRLAARPVHPGLEDMSASVLDRIAAPRPRQDRFAVTGALAAVLAVGMGLGGSWAMQAPAHKVATFDSSLALAPSTLLGGS